MKILPNFSKTNIKKQMPHGIIFALLHCKRKKKTFLSVRANLHNILVNAFIYSRWIVFCLPLCGRSKHCRGVIRVEPVSQE